MPAYKIYTDARKPSTDAGHFFSMRLGSSHPKLMRCLWTHAAGCRNTRACMRMAHAKVTRQRECAVLRRWCWGCGMSGTYGQVWREMRLQLLLQAKGASVVIVDRHLVGLRGSMQGSVLARRFGAGSRSCGTNCGRAFCCISLLAFYASS